MSYWRRTAWVRSSPRRRVLMGLLIVIAIAGMVVGDTAWRPAGLIGAGSLIALALVTVSAV